MNNLHYSPVAFKFQLSDLTLFSISLMMQVRVERLIDHTPPIDEPVPPSVELREGSQGFVIRCLPIAAELPPISHTGDYLRYVPLQYQHCYIDFNWSFEDYKKKFSSKTRSTIKRKIRKYAKYCGGTIPWKTYKTPADMLEFFSLARAVSQKTYQEKLFNGGLPESEDFIRQAESLAADQRLCAYIMFDGERPVSYLYCPVYDGVPVYAYLGYDPDYTRMSVGTVLQWLAIEQLFKEARFRYFDFTEGQSEHKRFFATNQRQCANVYFLKRTIRNRMLIYNHLVMANISKKLGTMLNRFGLKTKLKRFLRSRK